jgi:tetratricopeptide (TPR) repeat protein
MRATLLIAALTAVCVSAGELEKARDAQNRAALEAHIRTLAAVAEKQAENPQAHYQLALAHSYLAEVATEQRDKTLAKDAAENGMRAARKAVAMKGDKAEYRRILGTLCGQVIPANLMLAVKYGRCALEEVNKAIELDPTSALAYVSHGVGNYYLPPTFGGGIDKAIADFEKATQMNPKLAEAHLWLGVALRKANRNAEARKALQKSMQLNPNRLWAKEQFEKTPAN